MKGARPAWDLEDQNTRRAPVNTDTPLENSAATSGKRGLIKPDGRLIYG